MFVLKSTRSAGKVFRNDYEVLWAPCRTPKCYEMTDQEREEAVRNVDRMMRLRERDLENQQGYYGA